MPQINTLILNSATPLAPPTPLISEPSRTVTLPSLTRFHLSSTAEDCALALAHLVMPALTWLHVLAESFTLGSEDMRTLIPYVAQNIHGRQETEPFRSILIRGKRTQAKILAWTMPDADPEECNPNLMFAATGMEWDPDVSIEVFDAFFKLLPVDSVSTARGHTQLSKEFWLTHAPRWSAVVLARAGAPGPHSNQGI
jgi:hypothetical protein